MPFIEIPLDGVHEAQTVPEGVYALRIIDAEEKENEETGRERIQVMIEIENPPAGIDNAEPVFHNLNIPNENDSEKGRKFMLLEMKRFLVLFGIPFEGNGFSTEDLPGATAEGAVVEEEYEGRISNKLRLPPLEED